LAVILSLAICILIVGEYSPSPSPSFPEATKGLHGYNTSRGEVVDMIGFTEHYAA